jgi:hypothetical protein
VRDDYKLAVQCTVCLTVLHICHRGPDSSVVSVRDWESRRLQFDSYLYHFLLNFIVQCFSCEFQLALFIHFTLPSCFYVVHMSLVAICHIASECFHALGSKSWCLHLCCWVLQCNVWHCQQLVISHLTLSLCCHSCSIVMCINFDSISQVFSQHLTFSGLEPLEFWRHVSSSDIF